MLGSIAGIQTQSVFVPQVYLPIDGRTAVPSYAVRNALYNKYERMTVTITEGPNRGEIWRLYTVRAGFTIANWGNLDEHWELIDGPTLPPPPVDPGTIYEIDWAEAVGAVQGTGDPLVENTFIKVINRPVNQSPGDPTLNYGVFAGDIILYVTNAQATVMAGSRVRANPSTSELETETVYYDLVNDVIRRVYDKRGNDVWGDTGLATFPFFTETITGNYVAAGAQLFFSDNPVIVPSPSSNGFEWEIRNNHLDAGAVLSIGSSDIRRPFTVNNNYLEGGAEVYPFGGDGSGAYALTVTGCRIGAKAKLGNKGQMEVQLINCAMLAEFDLEPFLLGVYAQTYWLGVQGETLLQFNGKSLTPLASTFEVKWQVGDPLTLDLAELAWVGVIGLVSNLVGNLDLEGFANLVDMRPVTFYVADESADLETVTFVHHEDYLLGYEGEDTVLNVARHERVTIRTAAPGSTLPAVVAYETHTPDNDTGGHVIHDGNTVDEDDADTGYLQLPQRPNLIVMGPGATVSDEPGKNATLIYVENNEGEQGPPGKGYQTTSATANPLSLGPKQFVCDTPTSRLAYTPGARARASDPTDPAARYLEGIVLAATPHPDDPEELTLTIQPDHIVGGTYANPITAWNINLAGEPPLYRVGQVDYVAGKATLRLETGSLFEVDLNTPALGGGSAITLDYTGAATGKSVLIRIKQKAAAPYRTLAYQAGKFRTAHGWAVPLTMSSNAIDEMTGLFHQLAAGNYMSLVYKPNVTAIT